MNRVLFLCIALVVAVCALETEEATNEVYHAPIEGLEYLFLETFETFDHWEQSENPAYNGKFELGFPIHPAGIPNDQGLVVPDSARRYGAAAVLAKPIHILNEDFVVQYEMRAMNSQTCSGAYLKLLEPIESGAALTPDSPYSIMFGPDRCGATNKVHFIVRKLNPITKEVVEHHLTTAPPVPNDDITHVYTLIVKKNQDYQILIDGFSKAKGSLMTDMRPPIQPPEMIPDETEEKPVDWPAPKIVDEDDVAPEGWLFDEPEYVPDPAAEVPEDWDEEEDGEFLAPLVPNPKCEEVGCGEYVPRLIDNPEYTVWQPKDIPNPEFYEVETGAELPIGAVGIEIWTMDAGLFFNNILICRDPKTAEELRERTFDVRFAIENEYLQKKKADEAAEMRKKSREMRKQQKGLTGIVARFIDTIQVMLDTNPTLTITTIAFGVITIVVLIRKCRSTGEDVYEAVPTEEETDEETGDVEEDQLEMKEEVDATIQEQEEQETLAESQPEPETEPVSEPVPEPAPEAEPETEPEVQEQADEPEPESTTTPTATRRVSARAGRRSRRHIDE